MKIREEALRDAQAVFDLTQAAYAPMPFADGNEADLPARLRADGMLTLALVAEEAGRIVGEVAFSPAALSGSDGQWHALGPISVAPDRQRQGIGRALVAEGLSRLRAAGSDGVVLIGNPEVYHHYGFASFPGLTYRDLDTSLVMAHAFGDRQPSGEIAFAPALEAGA